MDPARVSETGGIPGGITGDATYLLVGDRTRTFFEFPIADASGNVDWNRSGGLDSGGFVRAGINHAVDGNCGASHNVKSRPKALVTRGTMAKITPDVVEFGGRLYSFWVGDDRTSVQYISDSHSGPNDKGSCRGGTGAMGESNCNTWDTPLRTLINYPVPVAGVSVLQWQDALVVATTDDNGELIAHLTSVNPSTGEISITSTRTVSSNILPDTEVEASLMYVNPTSVVPPFSASTLLALFVVEADPSGASGVVWWSTADFTTWRREIVLDAVGDPIPGRRPPGVTTWPHRSDLVPDPDAAGGYACGVFGRPRAGADTTDDAMFGCYNRATNRWTVATFGRENRARRPAIALHTLRASGDAQNPDSPAPPLGNDGFLGQFWVTTTLSNNLSWISVTPAFDNSTRPSWVTPPSKLDAMVDFWSPPLGNVGVPLVEAANLSALKGLFAGVRPLNDTIIVVDHERPDYPNNPDQGGYEAMMFLPFVDGTYHAGFTETLDFRVIERGLCLGLHGLTMDDEGGVCGRKNYHGY